MFHQAWFSVRTMLLAGVAAITAVTLLVIVMFLSQNRLVERANSWVLHTHDVTEHIEAISEQIKDATLYQRTYLVSGEASFLDAYHAIARDKDGPGPLQRNLDQLQGLTADNPIQQRSLADMRQASSDLFQYLDMLIAARQEGRNDTNSAESAMRSKELLDRIRVLTRMMLTEESHLLQERTHTNAMLAWRNMMLVLAAIGIFYTIKLLLSWLVYRQWKQTKAMEHKHQMRVLEVAAANDKLQNAYAELEKLNTQIRESGQARLRAVVDYALDGMITANKTGVIESFNPACERIFGYKAADVIGQNIRMLMPDIFAANSPDMRGSPIRELIGRRRDGGLFPLELSVSEFRLEGEDHYSGFLRDITARKQAETELLRYMKELEHSNQELDDFAYIASHDLKEPLRGLFNHASFLLEDYSAKLDEEGVRRLNRLSKLAQRMEQLVNDLLYFSRLGRSELAIQPTDPNQVVREIGQMMESSLKEKSASIVIPKTMPTMICDKPRITEVFRNLITNAVKYNDKSDRTVEVGFLKAANAPHGKENNVFYVRDNGIGIDPEFHSEIFRIFKRLNRDEGQESGTGVGLTFVKKIVERHKGHVWLESARGQGTTFFFNINQEQPHDEEHATHIAGRR